MAKRSTAGWATAGVLAAAAVAAVCGLSGCEGAGGARAQSDSVLDIFVPPSPVVAVQWAADPYDADKRQRGILLLANAPFGGEPPYMRMYVHSLADDDPSVRAVAVKALALHGDVSHAQAIAGLLASDRDDEVRWEAARALQRLHDPAVVAALIAATEANRERHADVRAAAAAALGQYQETRVYQALLGALADRQLRVNQAARESLRTLTGEDHKFEVAQWLAWSQSEPTLFDNGTPYIYPVFQRDPRLVEKLLFWLEPPNEIAAPPAGMPPPTDAPAAPAADETDGNPGG